MKDAKFHAEIARLEQEGLANLRADDGPVAIGRLLGVDHGSVSRWERVPLQYISKLCKKYGAPPHRYRPDLFAMPTMLKELVGLDK